MRVYWIDGKRKRAIKYHVTFNLATAMHLARALQQCGKACVWIEKGLAHADLPG